MGIIFRPPNIGKLEKKRNVKRLIKALSHKDEYTQSAALGALSRLTESISFEDLKKDEIEKAIKYSIEILDVADKELCEWKSREYYIEPNHGRSTIDYRAYLEVESLKKRFDEKRQEARKLIFRIYNLVDVQFLIEMLKKEPKSYMYRFMKDVLVKVGKPAVESLIDIIAYNEREKETDLPPIIAIRILGEIKDTRAINPLIDAQKSESLRSEAEEALCNIEDKSAIEPLMEALEEALKDEKWDFAKSLARCLSKIDEKRFGPFRFVGLLDFSELSEATKNGQSFVNALFKASEEKMKEIEIEEEVYKIVKYKGWKVAVSNNIDFLIGILDDKDRSLRERAAVLLGKSGEKKAGGPLIDALLDKDWQVRGKAAMALKMITERDFGEDYSEWKKWWEETKEKFIKKK